ncbi:MAG: hypothetical protein ABWY02_13145 [Telluria sp.]
MHGDADTTGERVRRALPCRRRKMAPASHLQSIQMENNDQRYLVQQNKIADGDKKPPVFAKVMRSKEGKFEGVSFIKNKEKATVMTVAEAREVTDWAASKKSNANEYVTKVICLGQ